MSDAPITIPAAEANRSFSKLLRAVREGARVTITSHGEPVAELGPVGGSEEEREMLRRREAQSALVEHIKSVKPRVVGPWTRDELYERG
ncbi:MAG: type II toxin-antitoxin system Phd/YefM family antitoxin [Caulobacteraceae bacterium]